MPKIIKKIALPSVSAKWPDGLKYVHKLAIFSLFSKAIYEYKNPI
jgi:hypothetical protein